MFGDQVKKLRTAQNLSQTELANKLSCSKQAVSNWENENIMPSVEILKKIANYFGCTTDYLLELDNRTMLDISSLSIDQQAHLQLLVQDFMNANHFSSN